MINTRVITAENQSDAEMNPQIMLHYKSNVSKQLQVTTFWSFQTYQGRHTEKPKTVSEGNSFEDMISSASCIKLIPLPNITHKDT